MTLNKIKISSFFENILFIIELFILMPVDYFDSIASVTVALKYIRIIILCYELLIFAYNRLQIKMRKEVLITILSLMTFVVIQSIVVLFLNPSYSITMFNYLVSIITLIAVLHRKLKNNYTFCLKNLSVFAFLILIINLSSMIIFENGLYTENLHEGASHLHSCFFLGVDNQFGAFLFPLMTILFFYLELTNAKIIPKLFCMCLFLATYLYCFSGTGLILSVFMVLLLLLYKNKIISKFFNVRIMFLIYIVLFVCIVMLQMLSASNNIIGYIIYQIMNKDITFSGRTNIWSEALNMIKESPLFGYGKRGGQYIHYANSYYSAHNVFLQMLLESGIIGFVAFCSALVSMIKRIGNVGKIDSKNENYLYWNPGFVSILYV